jgi:TPR repeat protein
MKHLAALDCYIKAANLGSAHAQLWIGNFYSRGLGVEQNQTEAAKWYQEAAAQGHADALVNLALLYKNGTGVVKNIDKAIELDLQAIQMGSAIAAGNLGSLYEFASDEHQSYALARKYYEVAISLGTNQYPVYNNLASIYEEGKGISVDNIKAEAYYLKAIELGSKQAKQNYAVFANNRGVAFADGKGVAKDYAKAEAYYLQAIKYGNQQAQSNYEILKRNRAAFQTNSSMPSTKSSTSNNSWLWIIAGILALFLLIGIGSSGDNSDKSNTRTCAWCNGTGYSGNGAQTVEEYVFMKTPCKKCGGDGKY